MAAFITLHSAGKDSTEYRLNVDYIISVLHAPSSVTEEQEIEVETPEGTTINNVVTTTVIDRAKIAVHGSRQSGYVVRETYDEVCAMIDKALAHPMYKLDIDYDVLAQTIANGMAAYDVGKDTA